MSSIHKTPFVNAKALPDVQYAGGPYYTVGGNKYLFPFVFKNGELDLQYINGFTALYTGTPQGTTIEEEGGLVRRLGGINLVQKLGSKFKKYIESVTWVDTTGGLMYTATHAKVYKPGLVTKVQQLSDQNLPNDINPIDSYISTDKAPDSDFAVNITGYGSTYVFEKPLVVVVDATGTSPIQSLGKRYITFYTSWDN